MERHAGKEDGRCAAGRGPEARPAEACDDRDRNDGAGACQVCLAALVRVKLKWVCSRCGMIYETCCDGGRMR